ncbi:hypothetical protein HNR00_003055 [Methylorubrum rhodinum]|uniref:Uncharacterized protein n=1 Tax=Methylorubrum rhodinum TaxID=29428 RepID=A0A840ZMP2_9HYPH|nr:hypothetical protein [Methylorubrum rhodinum]MBB5758335.1 hypothetical protein [Methylorubrum rhodinum]
MDERVHLPTFGVQLLISSLDGRPGIDRLLTLRLSEGLERMRNRSNAPLPEQPIRDAALLQGTIDRFRTDWPAKLAPGTPYAAIDIMLRNIVNALKPGEAGFMVVVSDGEFGDQPDETALRRAYEAYKAQLDRKEASLQVEFLLIAFPDRLRLEQIVENQKVRKTLLDVFNGGVANAQGTAPKGQHDVGDINDLLKSLKRVIAAVSGTAENLAETYVQTAGVMRTIDTPLAISRIVTLATSSDKQKLPHLSATSFTGAERFVYASRMDRADVAAPNFKQFGETTQLVFAPRLLYAGKHILTFDRPIGDDVMMVFQTAAAATLDILTEAGAPVATDSQARRILARGARYRLAATLLDETPQGPRPISLGSLRGRTTFEAILDGSGGPRRLPMAVDPGTDRAVVDFTAGPPGEGTARGEVTLEGFITSPSQPMRLSIVDGVTKFETRLRGLESCPVCAPGAIGATFDSTGRQTDIAEGTITPHGALSGTTKLDRSGMPAWIEVVDDAGNILSDGAAIPITPKKEIRFKLRHTGTLPADLPNATAPFALVFKTEEPLSGEGLVEGAVQIGTAPATLQLREKHGPDDADGRLVATATALSDSSLDLVFALEGAITPSAPSQFSVTYDGQMFRVDVVESANGRVVLRPRAEWWCACFLWFDAGLHRISVAYRGPGGLQSAHAEAEIVVAPTHREILTGCALFLGLLLIAAWFIGVVVVTSKTARFPKGAVAEIQEGQQLPRHIDLRARNLTFLKALFWPVRRFWTRSVVPHECRLVEGLLVVARRGGYVLRLNKELSAEIRGHTIQEILSKNSDLFSIRMNWREEISMCGPPVVRIRILRSISDIAY